MVQSTCGQLHVAIIMDGNGRWARRQGRSRIVGHRAGAKAVRRTVEAAPSLGVGTLTLYAFSCENWLRPSQEVSALMALFGRHLRQQTEQCVAKGVRLEVFGRRDRLDPELLKQVQHGEERTARGDRLRLRIGVDYSGRDAAWRAARMAQARSDLRRDEFERALDHALHNRSPTPAVDLLIRTGGEQRLSDQFGWECAYAELLFLDAMWPDFNRGRLEAAIAEFRRRRRRFGGLPAAAAS